ncbi:MAG: hypothetical protein DRG24_10090 [Epsilonproteobacteria bacterium]|nr:MAG: hypothetical protein DRG24_10090 [Campylobacterota bacterium]
MIKQYTVLLFLLITALFSGCAQSVEEKQLVKRDKNITIKLEAKVFPSIRQDILSPVDGTITEIYLNNGDRVQKDDLLYQIDTTLIELDIKRLQYEVKMIKKRLGRLSSLKKESRYSDETIRYNAKQYLQKIVRLHAEGYATESELAGARRQYNETLTTYREKNFSNEEGKDAQIIALRQKKDQLKKAHSQIELSTIKSNYKGYLISSNLRVGSHIGRSSKMASIINIDSIIVKAGLAPGLYPFIREGQKVRIDFIVTPPYSVEANISRIIPVIDPKFKRMIVEVKLNNTNYILQDGMKALVTIALDKEHQETVDKYFIEQKEQTIVEVRSHIN